MPTKKGDKLQCQRCGYTWTNRVENPKQCPNPRCHAQLYDYPRPPRRR